uniref:Putative secreted protein n=1 Tax=Anopheles triannulatus TaxID=58253 RepID=A0A2M4B3S8_9DIPT
MQHAVATCACCCSLFLPLGTSVRARRAGAVCVQLIPSFILFSFLHRGGGFPCCAFSRGNPRSARSRNTQSRQWTERTNRIAVERNRNNNSTKKKTATENAERQCNRGQARHSLSVLMRTSYITYIPTIPHPEHASRGMCYTQPLGPSYLPAPAHHG